MNIIVEELKEQDLMKTYIVKLAIKTNYNPDKWNWDEILDLDADEVVCVKRIYEVNNCGCFSKEEHNE